MKIWTKLKCTSPKNAGFLARSFFEDFNVDSSLEIKGGEVKLEVVFDQRVTARLKKSGKYMTILPFLKELVNPEVENSGTTKENVTVIKSNRDNTVGSSLKVQVPERLCLQLMSIRISKFYLICLENRHSRLISRVSVV